MADRTPPQCAPVRRPDLVAPHRVVDVLHGTKQHQIDVRIALMHGANYNDPMCWQFAGQGGAGESQRFLAR